MKEIFEKNKKIIGVGIAICFILAVFMCVPTTVEVSTQEMEEYEEKYTVQEKYTVKVPYIVKIQEPVYKTVLHEDPIYETLYTYKLKDYGFWGSKYYTIENVYNLVYLYTGNDDYKVTVYYYDNLQKYEQDYYTISDWWSLDSYQQIVSYNKWSEKVIDRYVTKEKIETREEIKFKDVEKTRTKEREITVTETVNCLMYEKIFGMV